MYIKLNDGVAEPYSLSAIKNDNPSVSFPKMVTDEIAAEYGIYPAVVEAQPDFNVATHNCELSTTATQVDGVWTYTWNVTEKSADEITNHNDSLARQVRAERETKLKASDWMALSDVTMTAEWSTYRQALRDVPEQAGFPHTITWPEEPTS